MDGGRRTIARIGISIPIVFLLGMLVWDVVFKTRYDWILGVMLLTVASISFFGSLSLSDAPIGTLALDSGALRTAIAISTFSVFFVMLATTLFLTSPDKVGPLTDSMVKSFTTIVGVVVAFYFGSSAYVQVQGLKGSGSKPRAASRRRQPR